MGKEPADNPPKAPPRWCLPASALSALLGLALLAEQADRLSATYDEVTYLQVGARWWRTGEQENITRMGSPLTFWKLQQAPTLWALDRLGHAEWVDDPIAHQAELLPVIRLGGSWIWLAGLVIAAAWARQLHGPRAMAMAATLFALGPNLQAHGALATMELPLVAATSAMAFAFWAFLARGDRRWFWLSAAIGGLAFSCKFTTVLFPPILALIWLVDLWLARDRSRGPLLGLARAVATVVPRMLLFGLVMMAANLAVTGFATLPLSVREGSHPILAGKLPPSLEAWANRLLAGRYPQDWVGFATQAMHQRNGGPSYLLGERRTTGWPHYYPVTLAVKLPIAAWFLLAVRASRVRRGPGRSGDRGWMLPALIGVFLALAMAGSKRNYGFRYLLPLAVPAIVWLSGLAEGARWPRRLAWLGVAGVAAATAAIHPHELAYFNELAGGPIGGRRVLADSNLDWGQGAKSLARLQRSRAEFRDLTLYYFGDTDPARYGVVGRRIVFNAIREPADMPSRLAAETPFLAVSASLQFGPWGPPGYFRRLDPIRPFAYTDDSTIAIYRTADVFGP